MDIYYKQSVGNPNPI